MRFLSFAFFLTCLAFPSFAVTLDGSGNPIYCTPNDPKFESPQECLGDYCSPSKLGVTVADTGGKNLIACMRTGVGNETKWKGMTSTESASGMKTCKGTSWVTFNNGTSNSWPTSVPYPAGCTTCNNPVIVARSITESWSCLDSAGVCNGACNNDPGTTSTDLHAYASFPANGSTFTLFLSANSVLCIPNPSPKFYINWVLMCDPD